MAPMALFRGSRSKRRLRFLIAGIAFAVYLLYSYLSSNSYSAPTFETKYYPHSGWLKPNKFTSQHRRKIQFDFKRNSVQAGNEEKAKQIVNTMKRTFLKYKLQAWGQDEVKPITGNGRTTRNGWGATIVDTLTTTALMGLEEEFLMELNFTIYDLDFDKAEGLVDPFETTIRYLGAMVSTVDLIDSGIVRQDLVTQAQRNKLLAQAIKLAKKLAPGFDSPTGMIWPRVNFTSNKGCIEPLGERAIPDLDRPLTEPARIGTNYLEYAVLSKLTGDAEYVRNASRAWSSLVWSKNSEDMPGLVDSPIDLITGKALNRHRSWGAGHDSYYEYLIKARILAPHDRQSKKFQDRWVQAVESTKKHLVKRGTPKEGETKGKLFIAQWRDGWLINEMGHLTCFAGGNFLHGGRYLGRRDIVELGLDIVDTCHDMYITSKTRIGPEYINFTPVPADQPAYEPTSSGHLEQVRRVGFWVTDARWMLRPETVESYFYAYRITGDKKYQEWAWDAYEAMLAACTAEFGYAEIKDVTLPPSPENQSDSAQSYWGAETLKYLYLIFAHESVGNLNQWVFSTEGHPFKIMS